MDRPRKPVAGNRLKTVLLLTSAALLGGLPAHAQTSPSPQNLMGAPGLIDMPSARMAPDGQLSVSASFFENTQRYNLGFQALPWLETSFRYSGLSHFNPEYPVYYDRSLGVKVRLWNEGDVLPAVAVGINDIVGTGIYGEEFVVASKQAGDFDFTVGMGWGRLSSANSFKNPLGVLSKSFLAQRADAFTPGGTNFSALFHGPKAGVFGGVTWQTPIENLKLSMEYSSDNYREEHTVGSFTSGDNFLPKTQANVGLSYLIDGNVMLGLDWLYGRSIGGNISFLLDPTIDPYPVRIGAEPPPVRIRTDQEQVNAINTLARPRQAAADNARLADRLWDAAFAPQNVSIKGRTLQLTVDRGDTSAICEVVADMAGDGNTNFASISVRKGTDTARCAVSSNPLGRYFLSQDTGITTAASPLILASSRITTIDATPQQNAADLRAATALVRKHLKQQGLMIEALQITNSEATVYYANYTYGRERDALDRAVRVLMQDAPPSVEKFRLIATIASIPQREFDVLRSQVERETQQAGGIALAGAAGNGQPAPMNNPVLAAATSQNYPRFNWSIFPQFRQQLFDPSNPLAVQFLGALGASVDVLPGLSLFAEGEFDIYDNFNSLRVSDSVLPHVRTDFVKYFSEGKNGIGDLEARYQFRASPTVFATVRAGYIESMFAGVGGEVLWRPEGQRWALGADLYEVQQRGFDRLLDLQHYRVTTGHVTLYYASPWYDLNFAVHAGQYLAGDRGFTFEATRRFESGVEIGAFFTKTNVSAQDFGEGSFDKGIMIRIPLGWIAPMNTQSQFNVDLRPVQRDGGQRLLADATLYDQTRRASPSELDIGNVANN